MGIIFSSARLSVRNYACGMFRRLQELKQKSQQLDDIRVQQHCHVSEQLDRWSGHIDGEKNAYNESGEAKKEHNTANEKRNEDHEDCDSLCGRESEENGTNSLIPAVCIQNSPEKCPAKMKTILLDVFNVKHDGGPIGNSRDWRERLHEVSEYLSDCDDVTDEEGQIINIKQYYSANLKRIGKPLYSRVQGNELCNIVKIGKRKERYMAEISANDNGNTNNERKKRKRDLENKENEGVMWKNNKKKKLPKNKETKNVQINELKKIKTLKLKNANEELRRSTRVRRKSQPPFR